MRTFRGCLFATLTVVFFLSGTSFAATVALEGKNLYCVALPYDFPSKEKDFPALDLPDNALLLLGGEKRRCDASVVSVEQNGKTYSASGWRVFYVYGAFHIVYFDAAFNKFAPYKLRADVPGAPVEIAVEGAALTALVGAAAKRGSVAWRDPVTEEDMEKSDPLDLAELLSRGRFVEYADEALFLVKKGGLPRLRMEARSAFDSGDYLRAACLATMALKWAPSSEPPEARSAAMFQDWTVAARSFRAMLRPIAAARAYDEALKIRKDPAIQTERDELPKRASSPTAPPPPMQLPPPPFRSELSDVEEAGARHGSIPPPESERLVIEGGVRANGVYIGDYVGRVVAQCGEPSETFSGMLMFPGESKCPEAVFVSSQNRVYLIRTRKGKTAQTIGVGDALESVKKKLGAPDRKEPITDSGAKKTGVRWVYLKYKTAFIDFNGEGKIDAVEVFDYALAP